MKRALLAIVLAALPVMTVEAASPTPVEIWSSGDDSLTQKLVDALRRAVSQEPQFRLAYANTSGALKILIPTHAAWKPGDDAIQITAVAEFSIDGRALGHTTVTCTDNSFNVCANGIVAAAKKAAGIDASSP